MKFNLVDSVPSAASFLSGLVFNIIHIACGGTWNQELRSFNLDGTAVKQLGLSLYLSFLSLGLIYCMSLMPVAFNPPADIECMCSLPFSLG